MTVYQSDSKNTRVVTLQTSSGWDYQVFSFPGYEVQYVCGSGGPYESEEEAIRYAQGSEGQLAKTDLHGVLDGWPGPKPPYVTPENAVPIVAGELWRFGTRRLRVIRYYRGPDCMGGGMRVSGRYVDPSGRERGTQIVGRRPALSDYTEERFREKFRPCVVATRPVKKRSHRPRVG